MNRELNIETGYLQADVDTVYDSETNKIDVYTNVYWTAESEEEYNEKEKLIANWGFENDLITAFAWCDISGFEYWVKDREENNYVSIDVSLKKPATEYTQEEIFSIGQLIGSWDDYFYNKLGGI